MAWVVIVLLAAPRRQPPLNPPRLVVARLFAVMHAAVVLLFGLYPDGRFTPRWIVVPVSLEIALQAINVASASPAEAQPWWPWHFLVTLGVTLLGGQVYRYRRRSSVDERERTRWPVLAVLAMVFAYTLWAFTVLLGSGLAGRQAAVAVLLLALPGVGFALGLLVPRSVNVEMLRCAGAS